MNILKNLNSALGELEMQDQGWAITCSKDYLDYCLAACVSLRMNAGACASLPIVVVLLDKIDSGYYANFKQLNCDIWNLQKTCALISKYLKMKFIGTQCSRLLASIVKATVPFWSPFTRTCYLDADTIILKKLDCIWSHYIPSKITMAVEAAKPYNTYVLDEKGFQEQWSISYSDVIDLDIPLYNTGVIISDNQCQPLCKEWAMLLLRLTTSGWEKTVVMDDQLWLSVALAKHPEFKPMILPNRFNTLYLHHMRGNITLSIIDNGLYTIPREQVHLFHLAGMKKLIEDGNDEPLVLFVRQKVEELLSTLI